MIKLIEADKRLLTDAEFNVIEKIEKDPGFFIDNTIAILSKKYFVAQSTISRLAKHLGFSNIKQMQMDVYAKFHLNGGDKEKAGKDTSIIGVASNMKQIYLYGLNETINHLDYDMLQEISDAILNHECIYIYGIGDSAIARDVLVSNLKVIGLQTMPIDSLESMMIMMNNLNKKDMLIVFSVSGTNQEVLRLLAAIQDFSLTVVLITANNVPLDDRYKVTFQLIFRMHRFDLMHFATLSAKNVQNFIADVIFSYLVENNERYREKIIHINDLRRRWK